jgi:hypothetical protein
VQLATNKVRSLRACGVGSTDVRDCSSSCCCCCSPPELHGSFENILILNDQMVLNRVIKVGKVNQSGAREEVEYRAFHDVRLVILEAPIVRKFVTQQF